MKKAKEDLCERRLKLAASNKTPPWTMKQLDVVLKYLKGNKSRDPFGYANNIFQYKVAGEDLKQAILKLCNRIKSEQHFPEALEKCDITAIYKNKGERNNFNSYRGIFRVTIIRAILDRLIYNDEYETIDEALSDSNVGARKGRNIRDNVFVLNAVTNSIINGNKDAVDIQIFDVEKCFDALWVQECINDLYESGFDNDKLPILYLENKNAKIAIKNAQGKTRREIIHNVIMQGTVWASLCCTATMDKISQMIYKEDDLIYKYKGEVDVTCLGMVDDLLCVQKCNEKAIKTNATINAFIESKKLTLSKSKCQRIHLDKNKKNTRECQKLKIHDETMEDATKSKYLGDIIDHSGKVTANIEERRCKGFAIVNEILTILEEIPLGKYKLEIGLSLRQAMLLNGILFNSEAWHNLNEKEIRRLEEVDEYLLRALVHGHAKTPLEFLYLETGAIPIRYVIGSRRMCFLQTILKRADNEITKKIFKAQSKSPLKGDFYNLVKEDFRNIDEVMNEAAITETTVKAFKAHIKTKTRIAAFKYLEAKQSHHSKVKNIRYKALETQGYIKSHLFTDKDVSLLFALRSECLKECKANFKSQFQNENEILCKLCTEMKPDNQQHMVECKELISKIKSQELVNEKIEYEDIYKDTQKQKNITMMFSQLLKIRQNKKGENCPSTLQNQNCKVLKNGINVQYCTNNLSFGK